MNRKTQRKHTGKIRKNRRVREKVDISGLWQRHRDEAIKAFTGKGLVLSGVIAAIWRGPAVLNRRLGVMKHLETLLIRFGGITRKSLWPRLKACVAHGLIQIRHAVRHENRVALTGRMRRAWVGGFRVMLGLPDVIARARSFMMVNKGRRLKAIRAFFDPSRVRIESVSGYLRHSHTLTVVYTGGILFCVMMGAVVPVTFSGGTADDGLDVTAIAATIQPDDGQSVGDDNGPVKDRSSSVADASTADFYNPFYVFTQTGASEVNAYPLADPPGIVVDVPGMREPDAPAADMIGKDDRVVGVRRLVTSKGLRYIIRLNQSIKRIKSTTEGNVITVSPLS
ncbi:MAG: hypothetical protein JXX14_15920 [Deltaproteobacteria bacterium]|nr:hypothetical protein [Deltaproteobacteria bacterium]